MKVRIEKKKRKSTYVFYLIYPHNGKRPSKKIDGAYLYISPKNAIEREHNKQQKILVEKIRQKEENNILINNNDLSDLFRERKTFYDYADNVAKSRSRSSDSNKASWNMFLRAYSLFNPDPIYIQDIKSSHIREFKEYILHTLRMKNGKEYAHNTKATIFGLMLATFKQAVKDEIITKNPCLAVDSIKEKRTERVYLTQDEVNRLINTPCTETEVKNAFIFCCFNGLRISDMMQMKWSMIAKEGDTYFYKFDQQKTDDFENLPLNLESIKLLGSPKEDQEEKVFPSLHKNVWYRKGVKEWLENAKITKKVTFHKSRHTSAVLKLDAGVDIFTVSKLLGHKNLSTTQIYSDVMDKKKVEAANMVNFNMEGLKNTENAI